MIHFKNLLEINLKEEFERNKDKSNPKTPKDHQREAHKKMTEFFLQDEKNAGILVLPTGGGKTYTAVYWVLKNIISKNKKVLWLADQGFLLEQAREAFKESILEVDKSKRELVNIRIVSGSDRHDNPNHIEVSDDILLITAQTAISNWEDANDTKFKKFINTNAKNGDLFIVYDEAHHTPAFGRRNLLIGGSEGKTGIMEKFPKIQLLGLTATPSYTDKKHKGWLWEIFKEGIIFEVSKKRLEDKKILATPDFIQEKTTFNLVMSDADLEKVVFKHKEIPKEIIEQLAKNEDRNRFIAKYYCDNKSKFGKTIIFLDRWYQCRTIENYINEIAGKNIAASVFSYVDTNRDAEYINKRTSNTNDENLEKFKNGDLQVLINVRMLTEGVDVPDVNTVFITRDTNSSILFTQMIGRALRGEEAGGKKQTANIVLFTDNWNRHILFASNQLLGGLEDEQTKERGYRPLELIRIDLLDKLEFEYQKQEYEKSIFDLIPIGWYVVEYTDLIKEDMGDGQTQEVIESFVENVIVLAHELDLFKKFIAEFLTIHKNIIWEKEELDLDNAMRLIEGFLKSNNYSPNKATITKFIQIARHLGRNRGVEPTYFTFEQKSEIDLRKYVLEIRNKKWGREQAEEYLEAEYYSSSNPFLKVMFPDYEDFYRAYEYEYQVDRRIKKGIVEISEASQEIKVQRLAPEEIRKQVLSEDGHKCVCCGKANRLQIDHLVAYKYEEPQNDNPNLYQTLCGVCNREKNANSYNYRITNYDKSKMSLEDVQITTGTAPEEPHYFTRLINCYYKTSAVHKDTVKAISHGNSIWEAKIKQGTNPEENILMQKEALIEIIREKGYSLKDIRIEVY